MWSSCERWCHGSPCSPLQSVWQVIKTNTNGMIMGDKLEELNRFQIGKMLIQTD
jgi:hypothetical protein